MKRKFVLKIKNEYVMLAVFAAVTLLFIYGIENWSNSKISQTLQSIKPVCKAWTLFVNFSDDSRSLKISYTFPPNNVTCDKVLMRYMEFLLNGSDVNLTIIECSQICDKY